MSQEEYTIVIDAKLNETDLQKIEEQLKSLGIKRFKIVADTSDIKEADKDLKSVNSTIKSTDKSSKSLKDTLKSVFSRFTPQALIAYKAIGLIRKGFKEATDSVKKINEALTEYRIVTGASNTEAYQLFEKANKQAKEYGATTQELIKIRTEWARQGKSQAETEKLTQDSAVLSKVALMDEADAIQYLTATLNGYHLAVEQGSDIVDKYSKLDSSAAITAEGLAKASSRAADLARNSKITIDKYFAYLTTMNESVQPDDTAMVGTAMKTILARMRDIKAAKLELVDDDGTTELLSDVELALKKVGIDLRETVTEFDSSEAALDSLAEKWNTLSSTQQAALSKAFSGVRNQNFFMSLMSNYDRVKELADISANSVGAAQEKFEAYTDSIEAKSKIMQAAFESIAVNGISDETVKSIIEATTALITFIDKTNLLKGTLAGITAYGALKGFTILSTGIASASMKLNEFNAALKLLKAGDIGETQIQQLALLTDNLSKSQLQAVLSSQALNTEQRMVILTAQGMSTAEAEAALSAMGLATAEGTATGATATFSGALKGLWAILKANPFILIASAVAVAVIAFSALGNIVKNTSEKLKDSSQELQNIQSDLDGLNDELTTTKKRIDELLRKDHLTIVEQNELKKLKQVSDELERQIALREHSLAIAQEKNEGNFIKAVNAKKNEGHSQLMGGAQLPNVSAFSQMLNGYMEMDREWMSKYSDSLQEYLDELGDYDYSILSDQAKATVDYIKDIQNAYLVKKNENNDFELALKDVFNQARFSEGKDAIEQLNESGKLTADTFKNLYDNNDSVKAMIDNMKDVELVNDTTKESFELLTNQIIEADRVLGTIAKDEKVAFSDLIENSNTQETINKFKDDLSDLSTALEDLRNGDLSDSDILELIEKFPELASRSDDLDTALSDLIDTTQSEIGNQFEEWESNMPTQEDVDNLNGVKDTLNAIGDTANSVSKVAGEIEKLKSALDNLKSTYDDIQDVIDDYNKNGYFTLDNLQSIMDMQPEYINLLIDENGQINLNNQAYKDYVASKAKSLLVNELQDLYNSILGMKVEEAQAYANAKAFNEETRSVQDLLTATTQLYYTKAMAKDSANNTTAYTDAMKRSFSTAANYASMVDSYINSLSTSQNEFNAITNEAIDNTNEYKDALEAEKDALEDSKDALEDEKEALEDTKEALEKYKSELEDAKDSIQSLIDLTVDYIKQLKEDEKSALEEQIDALDKQKDALDESKDKYAELIDKKKEAIKAAYDEKKAQDELLDKEKSVAKDRLALEVARLDDSSAGRKAQKQAKDNLANSEKDLHDYQDERAYDFQIKELEDLQIKFEEGIEKRKTQIDSQVEHIKSKIDEIDKYLDNSRRLYEDACAMIDNDNGTLYSNLWNYTYTYTTQTKAEFDHLWSSAQEAIRNYIGDNNSLLNTMEWVQSEIYDTETQIGSLDNQIDEVQLSIDELDGQIDILQDSINDVSDSVDSQSGKVNDLGNSWSNATSNVSKYIDELNKIPDTTTTNNAYTDIPSNAKWYYDYYKDGEVKRAWSTKDNYSDAAGDIISEIQKQTGQYRSDVFGGMKHFASGTRSTPSAFVSQEKGLEAIFAKNPNGSGMYTLTTPDSQVFDAKRTDNLYDFSGNPEEFISKLADKGLSLLSGDELVGIGWGNLLSQTDTNSMLNHLFDGNDLTKSIIKNIINNNGNSVYNNDNSSNKPNINVNMPVNIQGDATPSTMNYLARREEEIIKRAYKYTMDNMTRIGEKFRR